MRILFLVALLFFLTLSVPGTLSATAPGGVSSDLEVWLKADAGLDEDDGDGVDTWADQSGNNNDATQTTANRRPTYRDNAEASINHNPVLDFDDDNDRFTLGNISAIKSESNYTIYTVGVREDADRNFIIGAEGNNTNQDLFLGYFDTDTVRLGQWGNNLDVNVDDFDSAETTPFILFGEFDGSGHRVWELYEADETENTNTNSTGLSGSRTTYIGRHNDSHYYDGWIAEVIIYDEDIATSSERAKIESYLALKYGLTLDQSDATDYVNTSGSVIWDASDNASYDHDIAGIGQDDDSELDQATSTAETTDAIITIGSASSQDDGDFLIWGNDDGDISAQIEDIPTGVEFRLSREWKLEETGNIGTVSIVFNLDNTELPQTGEADDYVLLKDTDGTFNNATFITTGASFSAGAIAFNGVDFTDGDYFTLALISDEEASLGGVFESLKFWLDADDITTLHTGSCSSDAPDADDDVACWEDKSGEAAHVTEIAGDCSEIEDDTQTCGIPTYQTNQFNGRATLEFDRDNKEALRYDLAANSKDWTGTNFTQFIAFEQQGTPAQYYSFFSNGNPAGGDHYQIDNNTDGEFRLFTNHSGDGDWAVFEEFDNTLKLYTVTANSSEFTLFSDGEEKNTLASPDGRIFEHYRINQNRNGSHLNNAKISEVIIYDRLLSGCELWAVNQYLGQKYGTDFGGGNPGGVGCTGIQAWYNAGAGVTTSGDDVTTWEDLGPSDNHATQSTEAEQPDYLATGLNDNPTVSFDGGDDSLVTSLDVGSTEYSNLSIYSVYQPRVDSAGSPWGNSDGGSDRLIVDNSTLNNTVSTGPDGDPANNLTNVSGLFNAPRPTLAVVYYDEGDDDASQVRVNGSTTNSFTAGHGSQSVNDFSLGFDGNSNYFDGEVAEIVIYDKLHDDTDRQKVETYLATKYGITLDASQDYIDSDSTTLFDSDGTHSGYTNDIAGIGRDDKQSLDQQTSSSSNSGAIIEVSSADSQDNDDFLFWGNDNGTTSEVGTNLPPGISKRLGRIWRFQETGNIGSVTLKFYLSGLSVAGDSATDFTLITDNNTNFSSGAATTSASSYSSSTKVVTFTDVDIDDNDYIALGTENGLLSVDIVNASGTVVTSPAVDFDEVNFSASAQTGTGILGVDNERIRINNATGNVAWTLSIAAASTTALWSAASSTYDFNDPTADAGDGDDDDDVGGQLTIDPADATITPQSGCSTDGISLGSESGFSEGVVDSITLASTDASADTNCFWDITEIDLSQTIPQSQSADTYQINLTLSIIAN